MVNEIVIYSNELNETDYDEIKSFFDEKLGTDLVVSFENVKGLLCCVLNDNR